MKNMSLAQIASAIGGTFYGDPALCSKEIDGVAIDSRKISPGYLFIPIKGARVDGHDFIPHVMNAGALCTLSEQNLNPAKSPYILVPSCEQALKDLAAYYRNTLDIKIIGITGSVGKTSTKEMIASILSQKYHVLKTEGNYNNEIGLPLTIFSIREEHEIAILEMGIDHFGEMSRLAAIAKPDIAVITNIGYAHVENLKDRSGILKAKTEMFDHLNPNPYILLNGDDDMLTTVKEVHNQKPAFFGLSEHCDIYADHLESIGLMGTACTIHFQNIHLPVTVPIPGRHMVLNALAGAYIGQLLEVSQAQIKSGIETLKAISGRTNIIKTDHLTIIDDCYNANPASLNASLDVLSSAKGGKSAVIGDMFELGDKEEELHYQCGEYAAQAGIDLLCCVGELAYQMYLGAQNHGNPNLKLYYFKTKQEFLSQISELFHRDDTILVKASNGMKFTEIVEALKKMELL